MELSRTLQLGHKHHKLPAGSSLVRKKLLKVQSEKGLTLVELILVVVLLAIISTLAITRLDSITGWKLEGDIREFASTWEFLYNEAFARGESYLLVLDLDKDHYYVRREVRLERGDFNEVDLLANLRTSSEQQRRATEEQDKLLSLEEEFKQEDSRQNAALEQQFYSIEFSDPEEGKRLAVPLEFPSLAKPQELTNGLEIRDVIIGGDKVSEGIVSLRLSPSGLAEFAVVHLLALDRPYTLVIHPATGRVRIEPGDKEYEASFQFKED